VSATLDPVLGSRIDPETGGWRPPPSETFVYKNPVYVSGDDANDASDTSGINGIYLDMSAPPHLLASAPATEDPYTQLKHNLELLLTTVLAPLMRKTQKQSLTHLACPRPLRRTHLKLNKRLANGNFGEVWRGSFHDKRVEKLCDVAIKMVKDADTLARTQPKHFDAEVRGLQSEACLHAMLDCPFIVSLVGIAPAPNGQVASPWLVLELMSEGSLQGLLKKRYTDGTLTISDQLQWAGDAAEGLRFLHKKDILHRDVAARNVLATMDKNAGRICCKISDLGLSRELRGEAYKMDRPEATPSAWRAPETFQTRIFTKAGDVYSFGIFLWEVMSAVGSPFARQWTTHAELQRKIVDGARPGLPSKCPTNVFDLMTECWVGDVNLRPPMGEVVTRLNRLWKLQTKARTDAPAAPLRSALPTVQAYMLNLDEHPKPAQRNLGSRSTHGSALYEMASPAPDAEAGSRPHYDLACDSSSLHGPVSGDKRWAGRTADADGRPPLPPRKAASRNANANVSVSNYPGSLTSYVEADRHSPGVPLLQGSYMLPRSATNDVDA
jgi:serine/threonine protein kinase